MRPATAVWALTEQTRGHMQIRTPVSELISSVSKAATATAESCKRNKRTTRIIRPVCAWYSARWTNGSWPMMPDRDCRIDLALSLSFSFSHSSFAYSHRDGAVAQRDGFPVICFVKTSRDSSRHHSCFDFPSRGLIGINEPAFQQNGTRMFSATS